MTTMGSELESSDAVLDRGRLWAIGAAVWAGLFAGMSAYWALGGDLGGDQLGVAIREQAEQRDAGFVRLLWITVALKLLVGALALALARRWGPEIPRRVLRLAVWIAGICLALYGGGDMLQAALVKAGIVDVPVSQGEDAVSWYLLLWGPIWLLGGVLFLLAAWEDRRKTPRRHGADHREIIAVRVSATTSPVSPTPIRPHRLRR